MEESDGLKDLEKLRKMGIDPFSVNRFERSHTIKDVTGEYKGIKPGEKKENLKISITGRIRSIRKHGKLSFADVEDSSGKIQIYASLEVVGKKDYEIFQLLNIGDIIGVHGGIIKTQKGELSILAKAIVVLSKALRPLPSEWFGLKDVELRHRQRYLDLLMNPEVKETFIKKTKIIQAMKEFLDSKGFLEVNTPVLQPIYGGALAKPFTTHHNALDMKLYLRIADELYLKRLIVGGLEKVYEIGPDFRNEGIDTKHNPEFNQMEFYQAYIDYKDVMKIVEEMIYYIAKKALGKTTIEYSEHKIDLKSPFKRITMHDSIKEFVKIDISKKDLKQLKEVAKENHIKLFDNITKGELLSEIFATLVQPKLIQPTFVMDYPIEISPFAKKKKDNQEFTERFELFIGGEECGNAFSELNDPLDQKERFIEQVKLREKGHEEAHAMDEDFVKALEYGMPPTGGFGIGIERLVMVLTDTKSIRDVILFPILRPEEK